MFSMTTTTIRQKLSDYIRFADEKKIRAIYTIIEDDLNQKIDLWNKAFISDMEKRELDTEKKAFEGKSWDAIKEKAKKKLSK